MLLIKTHDTEKNHPPASNFRVDREGFSVKKFSVNLVEIGDLSHQQRDQGNSSTELGSRTNSLTLSQPQDKMEKNRKNASSLGSHKTIKPKH